MGILGNRVGEQALANPFAATDWISVEVSAVGDQPGRMRQHAVAIWQRKRLLDWIIPRFAIVGCKPCSIGRHGNRQGQASIRCATFSATGIFARVLLFAFFLIRFLLLSQYSLESTFNFRLGLLL